MAQGIDRDKLRVAIRRLGNERVASLLDEAIDLVPDAKLAKLVERYVDLSALRPDAKRKGGLLADVKTFEKASLAGDYHESFNVNSKNYREMSKGTRTWIAECERLFARCVGDVGRGTPAETRDAFEILFGLLRHIDEGHDDVVFFADEGGSWQVGVDWKKVLPGWFTCLATTAEPEAYARQVVEVVDEFDGHDRVKHMAAARKVGTPAQRKALQGEGRPRNGRNREHRTGRNP